VSPSSQYQENSSEIQDNGLGPSSRNQPVSPLHCYSLNV